jgi:hypothetical protein
VASGSECSRSESDSCSHCQNQNAAAAGAATACAVAEYMCPSEALPPTPHSAEASARVVALAWGGRLRRQAACRGRELRGHSYLSHGVVARRLRPVSKYQKHWPHLGYSFAATRPGRHVTHAPLALAAHEPLPPTGNPTASVIVRLRVGSLARLGDGGLRSEEGSSCVTAPATAAGGPVAPAARIG